MATLPTFFRRTGMPRSAAAPAVAPNAPGPVRLPPDPFELRALPGEEVYFHRKKINNERLVREPDPQARGTCWSAIGTAGLALALLAGVLAPNVASRIAGYRLEALRAEQRRLLDEKQVLEVQEAELLSPARLARLAKERNLGTPAPGQVVHVNGKGDGTVAMIK